jgi:hypothetical protein
MKRDEVVARLNALADAMVDVACELDYFAGFNAEWLNKSKEMRGAAGIAQEWAAELELQGREDGAG